MKIALAGGDFGAFFSKDFCVHKNCDLLLLSTHWCRLLRGNEVLNFEDTLGMVLDNWLWWPCLSRELG